MSHARIYNLAPRICAVVHVAAGFATLAWITGGSEAEPNLSARAAFIATHILKWRIAWFIWMMAAVSLIGFFAWWAARSPRPHLARAALLIGCAGLFADFFADALFIGWFPTDYARVAPLTLFVSQVVANGLYSLAGSLLMIASVPMPRWFRAWGWVAWGTGFALAIAGAMRWEAMIVTTAGLLLVTFTPWVWFANRFLDKPQ